MLLTNLGVAKKLPATIQYGRTKPPKMLPMLVARPVAAPKQAARTAVGFSNHHAPQKKLAAVNAVSAMSVVARPACASTVGRNVKRNAAVTASSGPYVLRAQRNTTTEATQKNGRMPRRANARVRSYWPP